MHVLWGAYISLISWPIYMFYGIWWGLFGDVSFFKWECETQGLIYYPKGWAFLIECGVMQ
jgi:hypothetical protein